MARKKKGRPVHGWLVLDKPLNMTSTSAVGRTKRLLSAQKAGHAGTLDPLATGILPLAFGEATKTVSYAMDGEKAYQFTVRWGGETETDDTEGEITQQSDKRPTREEIEACLENFRGTIEQVPPRFSAIKLDGNRAYDLARDGEKVELEAREVEIKQLELIEIVDDSTAVFSATCGKGTYVRALARDFGRELGCFGHVIALRRTKVGPFDESTAWYSVRWADGEMPLVELTSSGFVLAADEPPPMRGYADIFAGDERILHGLVMCTWARDGMVGYEFKRGGSVQEIRVDHAPPAHSGLLSGPG